MKKVITFLFAAILLASCSDNSEQDLLETATTIDTFDGAFYEYGTTKESLETKFGKDYDTEGNSFSLGYHMVYDSPENGVIKTYYSLDNQETLFETEVLFHSGEENAKYLKNWLESFATFEVETNNSGLYSAHYTKGNVSIELSFFGNSYTALTIVYRDFTPMGTKVNPSDDGEIDDEDMREGSINKDEIEEPEDRQERASNINKDDIEKPDDRDERSINKDDIQHPDDRSRRASINKDEIGDDNDDDQQYEGLNRSNIERPGDQGKRLSVTPSNSGKIDDDDEEETGQERSVSVDKSKIKRPGSQKSSIQPSNNGNVNDKDVDDDGE